MPTRLSHDLAIETTRDEAARQGFVISMRQFVLGDLAGNMRTVYDRRVEPTFERTHGHPRAGAKRRARNS